MNYLISGGYKLASGWNKLISVGNNLRSGWNKLRTFKCDYPHLTLTEGPKVNYDHIRSITAHDFL